MDNLYFKEVNWPIIPLHISMYFIGLVFALFVFVFGAILYASRKANLKFEERRRNLIYTVFILGGWLIFVQIFSIAGFLNNVNQNPPMLAYLVVPPFLAVFYLGFHNRLFYLVDYIDGFWLVYVQSFRVFLEFLLLLLFMYNTIPKEMTFEGYNFDIVPALLSLPLSYFAYSRKMLSKKWILLWNIVGIFTVLIITVISILSTPYFNFFNSSIQNTIVFRFPFVWLPTFVVPFALFVHILSIRKVNKEMKMENKLPN